MTSNYVYSSTYPTVVGTTSTTFTIGTSSGSNGAWLSSNGTGCTNWSTSYTQNYTQPTLQVTGDADFAGDITLKGVSLSETLDAINKRLAILVPDPEKLEHFEALQKAYNHYKVLEALCELPKKE